MLISDNWIHAVFIWQSSDFSAWWLSYEDGMKPVAADKHPFYQIDMKTNIYLFIII